MKVYLDTTVLIAFLFGELSDVELELTLFQNKVTLLPLLDRIETLKYRRRLAIHDRFDQPQAALALKNECDYILTYDAHFARVSAVTAMKPEEFVESVAQLDEEQMQ
ncbi:MAG TPA: hypothetical protein EYP49_03360 [Anaerolineae bacterium]|nr:hypothetical protein [Anaerolineae bacterium]